MSKYDGHTPGPWRTGKEYGSEYLRPNIQILRDVTFVEGGSLTTYILGGVTYPTSIGNTAGSHERAANAHLIADAPMLLDQRDRLLSLIKLIAPEMRGLALVSPYAKSLAKMIDTLIADIEATE